MIIFLVIVFVIFLCDFVINWVILESLVFLLVCVKLIFILCLNLLEIIWIKVIWLWWCGFMLVWILKIKFEKFLVKGLIILFFVVLWLWGFGVNFKKVLRKVWILKFVRVELKNIGVRLLLRIVCFEKLLFVFWRSLIFFLICL